MRITPLYVLLGLVPAAVTIAQPATTQSAGVDLSTPTAAVRTMFTAVASADANALGQVFESRSAQSHDLVAAYGELIVAGRRLQETVRDKFSDDPAAGAAHPAANAAATATDLSKLETAQVQITGDTAAVQMADHRPPIHLHRTSGQWRVDLTQYAGATAKGLDEQIELNRSLATVMTEAADEINAGKYASAQEAESGIQQKIHAVIAKELKANPPTQPAVTQTSTSQPSTSQPATMPLREPPTGPPTGP